LQETRRELPFKEVPIVCVLTSSTDPRDRQRATELGASAFQNKPTDMDECVGFFNSLLP
jgi:CheY-like chemotaxis protein